MSTLDSIEPDSAMLNDPTFTLRVFGAGFIDGTTLVTLDGTPVSTLFLSDLELAVDIDPKQYDAATVVDVGVSDAPGSLAFTFGIESWDEFNDILVEDPSGEFAFVEDTDMSAVGTTVGTVGWPAGAENNRIPAEELSTVARITGG